MKINLSLGWCRTKPPHLVRMGQDGFIQCTKLQNFLIQDNCIRKVGGMEAYNSTSLGAMGIPFALRSYHIRADGELVKRTHIYYDGALKYGDEVAGNFKNTNMTNLSKSALPMYFTIQIAGNSVVYLMTGKDRVRKYDGNNAFSWEECAGDLKTVFDYESGTVHLDRAWYIVKGSSQIDYSNSLDPEHIADTVTIGSDKDSFCVRFVEGAGETLYVFKNNAIYQLYGRTPAQFEFRKITDKYGLASKRGIYPVGGGFVFLNTFDKELYFFGGTEAGIQPLTEEDIRLRDLMDTSPDALNNVCMTVHKGFFRFAFQDMDSAFDNNNCELVYNIHDPSAGGLPKWSLIKGTNVWCYSVWDNYGDDALVTGRTDIGKLMYHNRTNDFDGDAIECIVRTGEVTFSEDSIGRINDFYIKAKPGAYGVNSLFRYYMNGRYSVRADEEQSMRGETRDLGSIHISQQAIFNDNITAFVDYSRGNSVSCEIYDYNTGTTLELYSIAFKVQKRYKIRSQYA